MLHRNCRSKSTVAIMTFESLIQPLRSSVSSVVLFLVAMVYSASGWAQESAHDGLRLAPKVFRAAVERIKPSLVTIEAFGGIGPSAGKTKRGSSISQPGDGPTTGLVISSDGH